MTVVDDHETHPSCDPRDEGAAAIRAEHTGEQEAARGRGRDGQADARTSARGDHAAAVEIIRRHATRMPVLSANDLRADPEWERLHGPVRGAAVTTAIRRGWLRQIAFEASSSGSTHGHRIARYESTLHAARGSML
jgi:hypothetical protein